VESLEIKQVRELELVNNSISTEVYIYMHITNTNAN